MSFQTDNEDISPVNTTSEPTSAAAVDRGVSLHPLDSQFRNINSFLHLYLCRKNKQRKKKQSTRKGIEARVPQQVCRNM